jgi:hypothetical protein
MDDETMGEEPTGKNTTGLLPAPTIAEQPRSNDQRRMVIGGDAKVDSDGIDEVPGSESELSHDDLPEDSERASDADDEAMPLD